MKRKVRKYVEGGYGDVSSEDYGMGSREEMIERNIEENERRRQAEGVQTAPVRTPSITQPATVEDFQEPGTAGFSRTAIKTSPKPAARLATKPAAPPAPKPTVQPSQQAAKPMGRTAMGKTAEQEMSAISAGKQAAAKADLERRKAYDKPLEPVTPEANLIGGPALRGLRAAGAGLASKLAAKPTPKPRVEPRIPQEPQKALGMSSQRGSLSKPGAPAAKSGEVATRSGQLARRGKEPDMLETPKKKLPYEKDMGPVEYAAAKNKRRMLKRDSEGEDVIESRKSGGKVGSASRRGDGIASRGKTRGRYI